MTLPSRCRILLAIALLSPFFAALPVRAGDMPPDAVAWWRMDPTRFGSSQNAGPERATIMSALRAMVASNVVGDESKSRVIESLLAAGEVGAWPHSVCVLDFAAGRPADGDGMEIHRLQIVLELRSAADHRQFLRTIRAILIDAPRARAPGAPPLEGAGSQRVLELPGALSGVAYTQPGWPEWREVSWVSGDGVFLVGLGRGALERWLSAKQHAHDQAPPDQAGWRAHERLIDSERPPGDAFFGAYLNIDALRRGFPDAFVEGRCTRVFAALHLSDARDFMVHSRWIDPPKDSPLPAPRPTLIAIDATWTERSEPVGAVHRLAFSESAWPQGELAMTPPPGTYAIAIRADWRQWFDVCLDLAHAFTRNKDLAARRDETKTWHARHEDDLRRFLSTLKPWLVLSDTPTPIVPIPGATTFFTEFAPGSDSAPEELASLLSDFGPALAHDAAGVWWMRLDSAGIVRIPAWGFVGPAAQRTLVAGWGPPVVTMNRQRMQAK